MPGTISAATVAAVLSLHPVNTTLASPRLDFPVRQLHCLSSATYHEARSLSAKAQAAVAYTVMNRRHNQELFKRQDTICKVVIAPGQFPWVLKRQPSHRRYRLEDKNAWRDIVHLSAEVVNNQVHNPVPGATHFCMARFKNLYDWCRNGVHIATIEGIRFVKLRKTQKSIVPRKRS